MREIKSVESLAKSSVFAYLVLALVLALFTLSSPSAWAKDKGVGGSLDLEGKATIMGKGTGYVVIGEKHFLLPKRLTVKDKSGQEIPLARIKPPVKAFIRYSLRVEDNVAVLKSIDLLE